MSPDISRLSLYLRTRQKVYFYKTLSLLIWLHLVDFFAECVVGVVPSHDRKGRFST